MESTELTFAATDVKYARLRLGQLFVDKGFELQIGLFQYSYTV